MPKDDSKRVLTFANMSDYISFRHHTYEQPAGVKSIELKERGPRFEAKLYQVHSELLVQCRSGLAKLMGFSVAACWKRLQQSPWRTPLQIKLGTMDQAHADNEWVLRAYTRSAKKSKLAAQEEEESQ